MERKINEAKLTGSPITFSYSILPTRRDSDKVFTRNEIDSATSNSRSTLPVAHISVHHGTNDSTRGVSQFSGYSPGKAWPIVLKFGM